MDTEKKNHINSVCEALELTGSKVLVRSLSQFPQHEAVRSISTPPGQNASPSQATSP